MLFVLDGICRLLTNFAGKVVIITSLTGPLLMDVLEVVWCKLLVHDTD